MVKFRKKSPPFLVQDLALLHRKEGSFSPPPQGIFELKTCQRSLLLGPVSILKKLFKTHGSSKVDFFQADAAYHFLLKVGTGLQSKVHGETEIFGQLKHAWKQFQKKAVSTPYERYFSMLFEDIKEIRTQYIQQMGAHSYGSIVRKWFSPQKHSSVLLVGAGKLAKSVYPYLEKFEHVFLYNRTLTHAQTLIQQASPTLQKKTTLLKQEITGWQKAQLVILCVPETPKQDSLRKHWLQIYPKEQLIHLGIQRPKPFWNKTVPCLKTLKDVFSFQEALAPQKKKLLHFALQACQSRAKLRALAPPHFIPHGWEEAFLLAI